MGKLSFRVTGTSATPYEDVYKRYTQKPVFSNEEQEKRKSVCLSCPDLKNERCENKDCGCQLGPDRVKPWLNLTACPALNWL